MIVNWLLNWKWPFVGVWVTCCMAKWDLISIFIYSFLSPFSNLQLLLDDSALTGCLFCLHTISKTSPAMNRSFRYYMTLELPFTESGKLITHIYVYIHTKINYIHTLPILVIKNMSGLSLGTPPQPLFTFSQHYDGLQIPMVMTQPWKCTRLEARVSACTRWSKTRILQAFVDLEIYQITSLDQPSTCRYVQCKYFVL